MTEGFYVQVRYPQGRRWVTVVVSETRRAAATLAADAYKGLADRRGETPRQVRVVSASQILREGGNSDLGLAYSDLTRRADGKQ